MARGQRNVYTCTQGHTMTTVDLDDGVTPLYIRCRQPLKRPRGALCSQRAQSTFYRLPPGGWAPPSHGWYRPTVVERAGLEPAMQQHVDRGGLLLRILFPDDVLPPMPGGKASVKVVGERDAAPGIATPRPAPARRRRKP